MAKRVIALGFFDGVHLGHGALLRTTVQRARELQAEPAVLSFDSHPLNIIHPGVHVPLINTPADRELLVRRYYGIPTVLLLPFTRALMEMDWRDFIDHTLVDQGAVHVVAGENFHFGYHGEGTAEKLRAYTASHGIGCDIIPEVQMDGETVSSTRIRALLAKGDLDTANRYLGHPHCLSGTVRHGKALGRTIGIPTANLALPEDLQPLPYGVYACLCKLPDGAEPMAVVNIGVRPTVADGNYVSVEAWILDYRGDLYGQPITLDFYRMLRPERRFPSLEALQAEIRRNAEQTIAYFQTQRGIAP